jgi:hypothetical protein
MSEEVLEELAVAADRIADDQREVARRARRMQSQRDRGWSWTQVLDRQPAPGIIGLLRRSRLLLAATTSGLTATLAALLGGEGQSRRQIASRLGVTHQRVTTIVNHRPAEPPYS